MFTLHDVLAKAGLAPETVNVLLHSPREGNLQQVLPSLVRTRRTAMETFQSAHSPNAERALSQGRRHVASFVKIGPGQAQGQSRMLFAGLYDNPGGRSRPRDEIAADPEVAWLRDTFGSFAELDREDWTHWTWFDMSLSPILEAMQGRLVIETRLTQAYVRLAENINAPVTAILEQSRFDTPAPDWRDMRLSAGILQALPAAWAARLREWRGIYLILDESDGARYVGSAYGAENLLGRWRTHVSGESGVTVGLSARNPARFRFSILELTAPNATAEEVTALEQTWMERLDTIRFGLNRPEAIYR